MIALTLANEGLLNHTVILNNIKSSDEADGSLLLKQNASIQIEPLSSRVSGKSEIQIQPQNMNLACTMGKKVCLYLR